MTFLIRCSSVASDCANNGTLNAPAKANVATNSKSLRDRIFFMGSGTSNCQICSKPNYRPYHSPNSELFVPIAGIIHPPGKSPCRFVCGEIFESDIQNRIRPPVPVVKMPPLKLVDVEAFVLHRMTQHFSMPPLQRCPAGIAWIGTLRHFVIHPDHFDGLPSRQIVKT